MQSRIHQLRTASCFRMQADGYRDAECDNGDGSLCQLFPRSSNIFPGDKGKADRENRPRCHILVQFLGCAVQGAGDDLVHVVVLVFAEAAAENNVRLLRRERMVLLVELQIFRVV